MQQKNGLQNKFESSRRYSLVSVANKIRVVQHFHTIEELIRYCKRRPAEYPLQLDRLIWDNEDKRFIRVELREELL